MLSRRPIPSRPIRLSGLLLFLGSLSLAAPAEQIESWDIPGVGLRLTVPRDWSWMSDPDSGALLVTPPDGRGQLAVLSGTLPAVDDRSFDLEQAADASLASLRKSVRKFKLLGRRDVEVADRRAVELYFQGRVEGEKFRWIQTLLVHAGHQVILMYAAPDDFYLNHLGDYDQLLRSVRPAD